MIIQQLEEKLLRRIYLLTLLKEITNKGIIKKDISKLLKLAQPNLHNLLNDKLKLSTNKINIYIAKLKKKYDRIW